MDAQLKAKWVTALRSGEYKQARGTLKDETGAFCCLGVLCEVAGLRISEGGGGVGVLGEKYHGSSNAYRPIFELLGGQEASHQCSMRNDGVSEFRFHPHSFVELADYIEANIPDGEA